MSAPLKRMPWAKWSFSAWRAEPSLRMISRQARSLWLDLLGHMFDADPVGFLLIKGKAPTPAQIAALVGDPVAKVKGWLDEIREAGVASYVGDPMPPDVQAMIPPDMPQGTMLSRKMVRDAHRALVGRTYGVSGGNPTLKGDNPRDKAETETGIRDGISRPLRPRVKSRESRIPPSPPAEPIQRHPAWQPFEAVLIAEFGEPVCDAWMFRFALEIGEDRATRMVVPKQFIKNHLEQNFAEKLARKLAFSSLTVTVEPQGKKP